MGHSQREKTQSHERIVAIAAQRFRELGLDGLSIADLMQEAGLTHGGFYKHFQSREDLVLQAMSAALKSDSGDTANARPAAYKSYPHFIRTYLSKRHRDHVGEGCAVSALVNDAGRAGEGAKALYTDRVRRTFDRLCALADSPNDESARARAIFSFSAMVGALGLARAVSDPALSDEILDRVKQMLLSDDRSDSRRE